ncbi:MAG: ATP-binding protein [Desulfosarcina sp.]|nr:ATP-binding protein [Desulfobacterales bacterium]
MKESNQIELKRELTASLEKEVVAFLNYREGGHIYIGLEASGTVLGVPDGDAVQLKIKDRTKTISCHLRWVSLMLLPNNTMIERLSKLPLPAVLKNPIT